MKITTVAFTAALTLSPCLLHAQFDFKVDGRDVQVHSFFTQGYGYSNDNNYLTMKTSQGSFAMTDGGANVSTQINDKLRVGAQVYFYNVGDLGKWHPIFDWGYVDYKFNSYFGVRAGKVKTVLGLNNDTQDLSFLHTWALMPQSVYPLDLRAANIAHTGLDLYGNVPLHTAGSLGYTLYAGLASIDKYGGYYYAAGSAATVTGVRQQVTGGDLRWNTPITGLMFGSSVSIKKTHDDLMLTGGIPIWARTDPERIVAGYADFTHGNWHFSAEGRSDHSVLLTKGIYPGGAESPYDQSFTAWYVTAAYRVNKRLEVGTYRSMFDCATSTPLDPNSNHINDQVVTARVDLTKFWNVKAEGHFIQGYGDLYAARGFYPIDNTTGLKPNTNLLVLRASWYF